MSEFQDIEGMATSWSHVGSRVTCNPAPTDTDEDRLFLVGTSLDAVYRVMHEGGWEINGSEISDDENRLPPDERFHSFKLGQCNAIVTRNAGFYTRFLAATSVAKQFNLMAKADRIALFQAVLYGNRCDEAKAELPDTGSGYGDTMLAMNARDVL